MQRPDESEIATLAERIVHARILREHHVWEAVRCLSIDTRDRRSGTARRFVERMEADALLDAAMLLVMLSVQERTIDGIGHAGGCWTCSIGRPAAGKQAPARATSAKHADQAAAIVLSLILSHLPSRRCAGPEIPARKTNWRLAS